ncbi:MAG: flippase-like domain-containing protein, partial [Magnetococcales bacterium]|nr:flippase-like domain-containing protein [Magnetococcales bacterium]
MNGIKIVLAGGLLVWLFNSMQWPFTLLLDAFFSFDYFWVVLLILAHIIGQILRWLLLLQMQGVRLSFTIGMRLFLIGQFFLITSLGMVGGEAVRGYYVIQYSGSAKWAGASTVVVDRIIGLFTYLLVWGGSCLWLLAWGTPSLELLRFWWVVLLLTMGIVMFFIVLWSAVGQRVLFGFLPSRWRDGLQQVVTAYRPDHR